jgi:heme-degrading monooxygenase HmoA
MLVIIWEFRPRAERRAEFVTAYGARGSWAKLFERADGWLGTELARDARDASRYITIDRWTSRSAYDSFRNRFAAEYAALDAACEDFTVHEERVGEFESLTPE